jgi:predicted acylesterase/phospholipase RssA
MYILLTEQIFQTDQVVGGVIPVGDDECRFDFDVLETVLKDIVKEKLGDQDAIMEDQTTSACSTFVTGTSGLNADGPAVLFRSYRCKGHNADKCFIWQAGRATTAAPSFFKPMFIEEPLPGGWFIDGGIGHNNPTSLALDEGRRIYPNVKRFCVVSIGTGRQRSVRFVDSDMLISCPNPKPRQNFGFSIPGARIAHTLKRMPSGVHVLEKIAEACVALSTSSERVHQILFAMANSDNPDIAFPYYRFNVEQGMKDIGLQEWKRIVELADHTRRYLSESESRLKRDNCVLNLTKPSPRECT